MLVVWRAALRECCRIYAKLPSTETSTIGGDGARHFRRSAANIITICPRLCDGTLAAYVCPDDVRLDVSDATHQLLRVQVQVQLGTGCDGNITLQYTFGEDWDWTVAKLRVCVRVCGVLLVDVRVSAATFDSRTAGHLCGQHLCGQCEVNTGRISIAIHPAGTHLVIADTFQKEFKVYGMPEIKLLVTLSPKWGVEFPSGLCFTDAGALLVADLNNRVHNLTMEGNRIASYEMQRPYAVASRGNLFAVGTSTGVTSTGVRVCLLESGAVLHMWLDANYIKAVAFATADTIAVAIGDQGAAAGKTLQRTVCLYTLDGTLLKLLATGIDSRSLAVCADGCLLVSDDRQKRIRVLAPDGEELTASPLAAHRLKRESVIALNGEHLYLFTMEAASFWSWWYKIYVFG